MTEINKNELTKLDAYYKVTPGSEAERLWHKHWDNRTAAWKKLKQVVADITGISDPMVATRGQYFVGVCVEDPKNVPEGFSLTNKKEPKQCDGKWFVYPDGKTKKGKVLKQALDPNKLMKLPDVDDLVAMLGFGYGKQFFTIGNKFYQGLGYKEQDDSIKIQAFLFKHESGKFYFSDEGKLVDKLPLVDGLIEIPASEY